MHMHIATLLYMNKEKYFKKRGKRSIKLFPFWRGGVGGQSMLLHCPEVLIKQQMPLRTYPVLQVQRIIQMWKIQ